MIWHGIRRSVWARGFWRTERGGKGKPVAADRFSGTDGEAMPENESCPAGMRAGGEEEEMCDFISDVRFSGITPFKNRVALASPAMHGEELDYMTDVFRSGWMTTAGKYLGVLEQLLAEKTGMNHAVALVNGTSAIHLAVKLAADRLGRSASGIRMPSADGTGGCFKGIRVFCTDLTFAATVNPVIYEGGEPVFIDSEPDTWNMDPAALEKAFALYPDVKLVVMAHLYGTPGKIREIRAVCDKNDALLIEDAAESFGAQVNGRQTGSFGDYGVISFNGNKIITGSSGGALLVKDAYSARRAKKWSMQSREEVPWYEHKEIGYNYRMSNLTAAVICGQMKYLDAHIKAKKEIYERYKKGLEDLPLTLNPVSAGSNYWLSGARIHRNGTGKPGKHENGQHENGLYESNGTRTAPAFILKALEAFNCEGRPVWKPMHLQPVYQKYGFVTVSGNDRSPDSRRAGQSGGNIKDNGESVSGEIFRQGLCLPSDINMTPGEQDTIIEIIRRCFQPQMKRNGEQ